MPFILRTERNLRAINAAAELRFSVVVILHCTATYYFIIIDRIAYFNKNIASKLEIIYVFLCNFDINLYSFITFNQC